MEFSSGDIAVLLTDGLTEVANENEEDYGLERVKQQVTKHSGRVAEGSLRNAARGGEEVREANG